MEYRKILLTHDSSELANTAIAHAADLARATGASVLVLHVIESVADTMIHMTAGTTWAQSEATVQVAEEVVAAQRAEAEQTVARVEATLRAMGVSDVQTAVMEGTPGSAIVELAEREGYDLIAIATHGRSGVVRALLGSVADHVVRHAKCAVLVCRPPERAKE